MIYRRAVRAAIPSRLLFFLFLLACGAGHAACGSVGRRRDCRRSAGCGKSEADFPADPFDYFHDMDAESPANAGVGPQPLQLHPDEIKGRNTWMLWTGGNEAFWDWLANHSYGFVDLLKIVDFSPRARMATLRGSRPDRRTRHADTVDGRSLRTLHPPTGR